MTRLCPVLPHGGWPLSEEIRLLDPETFEAPRRLSLAEVRDQTGAGRAAARLGIPIVWGGDWPRLRDGPHFELDARRYP